MEGTSTTAPLRADPQHPDGQYGTWSKLFHWTTAPLIALALASGFVIEHIRDPDKMAFYALHESTGLVIFCLALARLAARRMAPPPALPAHLPKALRGAATGVHHLLYAVLVIQPLLGFLMTNAYGFPLQGETAFLGFIDLPRFMATNEGLGDALKAVHVAIGLALPLLLAAHVGGAVYHHAIRRDGTLMRML